MVAQALPDVEGRDLAVLEVLPAAVGETMQEWPLALTVVVVSVGGVVLLASIGTGQWLELRHHLPHCRSWLVTTGLAWLLGLAVFMLVAMPLWHEGQSTAVAVAVGMLGALGMASVVAAVTGWALLRLVRRPGQEIT